MRNILPWFYSWAMYSHHQRWWMKKGYWSIRVISADEADCNTGYRKSSWESLFCIEARGLPPVRMSVRFDWRFSKRSWECSLFWFWLPHKNFHRQTYRLFSHYDHGKPHNVLPIFHLFFCECFLRVWACYQWILEKSIVSYIYHSSIALCQTIIESVNYHNFFYKLSLSSENLLTCDFLKSMDGWT